MTEARRRPGGFAHQQKLVAVVVVTVVLALALDLAHGADLLPARAVRWWLALKSVLRWPGAIVGALLAAQLGGLLGYVLLRNNRAFKVGACVGLGAFACALIVWLW